MTKKKNLKEYGNYSYIGDETITMTVGEFIAIQKALDQAIQNGVITQHPQVIRWYDVKTLQPVDNPTEKQIKDKKVEIKADPNATKSPQNLRVSFEANLFPTVFEGREAAMGVHERMVDEGVAKPLDEVKAAYEERKAKGQMQVEVDADIPQDEKLKKPKRSMKVVRNTPKDEDKE